MYQISCFCVISLDTVLNDHLHFAFSHGVILRLVVGGGNIGCAPSPTYFLMILI